MARLRNISGLGPIEIPSLSLVLDAGEVFEVSDEVAGRAPSEGDAGEGLLAQTEHFELADAAPLGKASVTDTETESSSTEGENKTDEAEES